MTFHGEGLMHYPLHNPYNVIHDKCSVVMIRKMGRSKKGLVVTGGWEEEDKEKGKMRRRERWGEGKDEEM